jgi:hypothetical protein
VPVPVPVLALVLALALVFSKGWSKLESHSSEGSGYGLNCCPGRERADEEETSKR